MLPLLIALKPGRLSHSVDHEDSWVDITGYVCVADRVQRERTASNEPSNPTEQDCLPDLSVVGGHFRRTTGALPVVRVASTRATGRRT